MNFNLLFVKPEGRSIPDGFDGVLFDMLDAQDCMDIRNHYFTDQNFYNALWDAAYECEMRNPNTQYDFMSFHGGAGLLCVDPSWDGTDDIPLVFNDDVHVHIYTEGPSHVVEAAQKALSNCGVDVSFHELEPVRINASVTDKYNIPKATDGALLPSQMPPGLLIMDFEDLRKCVIEVLNSKIQEQLKDSPTSGIEINIYANGPKQATVETYNALQILADKYEKSGIPFHAAFYHLDRETGEYFPQEVHLACKNKKKLDMSYFDKKGEITFEICSERHGQNPLAVNGSVYGHEIPSDVMTDPERVEEDIADFIESIKLEQNFTNYHVSDVASGASMPLVAFLNTMVDQQTASSVYQYDNESKMYWNQDAITLMYKDKVIEMETPGQIYENQEQAKESRTHRTEDFER